VQELSPSSPSPPPVINLHIQLLHLYPEPHGQALQHSQLSGEQHLYIPQQLTEEKAELLKKMDDINTIIRKALNFIVNHITFL